MHNTTHFCIEVSNHVVNLQRVNFQPLQMYTKFQFREGKKCQWLPDYPVSIIQLHAAAPYYYRLFDDFRGNRS